MAGVAAVCGLLAGCDRPAPSSPELRNLYAACSDDNDTAAAISACTRLIAMSGISDQVRAAAYFMRAGHEMDLERYFHAIGDYTGALDIVPGDAATHFERAVAYHMTAQYGPLIDDLKAVLLRHPGHLESLNYLAWVLATGTDRRYRDGDEAVRLSVTVIRQSPDYVTLDTLAAAYAETGHFEAAAHEQRRAILDLRDGPEEWQSQFMPGYLERLALYEAGQTFSDRYQQALHAVPWPGAAADPAGPVWDRAAVSD